MKNECYAQLYDANVHTLSSYETKHGRYYGIYVRRKVLQSLKRQVQGFQKRRGVLETYYKPTRTVL